MYGYLHVIDIFVESCQHSGEVAEWTIAVVLKTIVLKGTGGSNPSFSAIFMGVFGFDSKMKVSV